MTDNIDLTEATRLRSEGATWKQIADRYGIGVAKLRNAIDPGFLDRMNAAKRESTRRNAPDPVAAFILRVDPGRPSPSEAAAALARIPPDTRPLTARLMGDPKQGQSALDRRQSA